MNLKQRIFIRTFNKNCTKNDARRDAGLKVPDGIEVIKDLYYGKGGIDNSLDVYKPKNAEGRLPLLVSCHGGGYIYGDKELYSFYTMEFAKAGFAVINFNYTLAPKITFPNPVIETNEVLKWAADNAEKYGFDLENVVMIGDSAGAQIASQYAVCVSNPEYAKIIGIEVPQFKLRALSLGCGIYSLSTEGSNTRELEKIYLTKDPSKLGDMLKITEHIDANYPPSFLISSPGDFLVKNLEPMKKVLEDAGVECKAKIYGDEQTYHVFFIDIRSNLGKECNADQIAFLKEHLS